MRCPPFLRRLLSALSIALLPSAYVYAQNVTYEVVTFDTTARGLSAVTVSPPGRPQLSTCEGKLEDGQIRIRYDGTNPTDTDGTLVDVGNTIRLEGHQSLETFKGIRTGATSGIIRFHCTQSPALELTGTGGGSSGGSGGDGALLDGANGTIKATVKDYTNSNPLTVVMVDTNGDVASVGGGTQYTEDAAAAANPIGNMGIARRKDTLSAAEVSADGDNIALNATAKGELYVKQTDPVPVTESGTWTVQPGNTANTTAWLVTGTGGTFPATQSGTWNVTNVSGTVSLPTGAATSANQSTEITALQLIDNIPITIGSTTSGQSGVLGMGAVTTSAPTYTTAQSAPLSLDTTGALRVTGASGTTQYAEDAVHTTGDSVVVMGAIRRDTTPSSSAGTAGDYSVPNLDANGRLYTNTTIYDASGAAVTLAADATTDSLAATTGPQVHHEAKDFDGAALPNAVSAEGDAVRPADSLYGVQYTMPVNEDGSKTPLVDEDVASANADLLMKVGAIRDDTLDARSGTEGDWEMLHLNANGALWTAPVQQPATPYFLSSAASTNATNIKSSAGNIYGYHLINTTATMYFLRMYNLSAAPTCSSATGFVKTIPIPASTTGAGIVVPIEVGEAYTTGISFCLTAGGSSTDNTNAATGVYLNFEYK